jgi:hypothetical protein
MHANVHESVVGICALNYWKPHSPKRLTLLY